ncbi:MAG: hypothetical protein H6737_05485 [Alphaproteobacteria bacterium]|nr:hypothetical protein [Alphaproteobacteria bacterium]
MLLLAWIVAFAEPTRPAHPVCGGIPGGMYDDVARVGDTLSVTMHRYISDDADPIHLGAVLFDAEGKALKRWRGEHAMSTWAQAAGAWVHRAEIPLPPGSAQVRLYDLHHERLCTIDLPDAGGVAILKVERTGEHTNPELPSIEASPVFDDETLEGDAVDVKRGRRARLAERELEEPPDNLEQRAMLLAKLKQNLPRMKRRQVLEWMAFQGFAPDDPDVLETLGPNWLDDVGE